ncbi:MAG: thiamine-phosphate kinase [Planctomycetota bacterium]
MAASENALLAAIYGRAAGDMPAGVVVGPGDDMAVVEVDGRRVLIGVDQVIEGVHFRLGELSIDRVAYKAIARSVSDVAAMAGLPTCAVVSAVLPRDAAYGDELAAALHRHGLAMGCPVVGGDIAIAEGALQLSVTVVGETGGVQPVLRSGARVGDGVYVTGVLGGSYASGWHASFVPRVAAGRALAEHATAMMDLSDGVAMDLGRLIEASDGHGAEGAVIDAAALPCRAGCDWRSAVGDGEDYELLFTAAAGVAVPEAVDGLAVTRIGEVAVSGGVVVRHADGHIESVGELGWEHGR